MWVTAVSPGPGTGPTFPPPSDRWLNEARRLPQPVPSEAQPRIQPFSKPGRDPGLGEGWPREQSPRREVGSGASRALLGPACRGAPGCDSAPGKRGEDDRRDGAVGTGAEIRGGGGPGDGVGRGRERSWGLQARLGTRRLLALVCWARGGGPDPFEVAVLGTCRPPPPAREGSMAAAQSLRPGFGHKAAPAGRRLGRRGPRGWVGQELVLRRGPPPLRVWGWRAQPAPPGSQVPGLELGAGARQRVG